MHGYRAYICYTRADEAMARKLRRALMRLVSSAQQTPLALLKGGPAASPLLMRRLGDAPLSQTDRFDIEASDHLVVLCSPGAHRLAMDEAVMAFKAKGRAHRIVPVITAGEPGASLTPGLEHRESLPHALRFAADAAGELTDHPVSPSVVDLRPDGLGPDAAAAHVAARITGAPLSLFMGVAAQRRRRRAWGAGVAAAASLAGLIAAPVLWRAIETTDRAETARAAGLAAHQALDEGRRDDAVASLTEVFPRGFAFDAPPFPVPAEALSALSRTRLEARELAEIAAPVESVGAFVALPQGAVAALGPDGEAHLLDLGSGDAVRVRQGRPDAASRVSPDGATLWAARFGPITQSDAGDAYAPLIFEDVNLAEGTVTLLTAVQSLPPQGGDVRISPDGARFAVDLRPGEADRTLIAVFNRYEQSLAGVASLPADRARIEFLSPDRLLLVANPPNVFGEAPGLYLWNLAEEAAPRVLRAPGLSPVCPGAGPAPRRAIAAEIAAGRLSAANWAVSADGAEIALLLPSVAGGSCLFRWDGRTGRSKPILRSDATSGRLAFIVADGPYAILPERGDLILMDDHGERPLTGCDGPAHHFADGGDPVILCEGGEATLAHHGYSGQRYWRGPKLPPLTAVARDPLNQHLILGQADGRIAIWDAAERGYQIARGAASAGLSRLDADHIAVTSPGASPAIFDTAGRLIEKTDENLSARASAANAPLVMALATTGFAAPAETCAALTAPDILHRSDSPSGARAAIETAAGLAVIDRATCLPVLRLDTRTVGSGPLLVGDDLLWAPLPGEVAVFPLSASPAQALASLHARMARQRLR